jgi:hypothetical protein
VLNEASPSLYYNSNGQLRDQNDASSPSHSESTSH